MDMLQMERRKVLPVVTLALLVALAVSAFAVAKPARADGPGTDGSVATWYNGNGSSTVYCVNADGTPTGSYVGGGIKVLGSTGQEQLRVSQAQIDQAAAGGLVVDSGIYKLYRLSDGSFELDSTPDAEGKTFLGQFSANCTGVTP